MLMKEIPNLKEGFFKEIICATTLISKPFPTCKTETVPQKALTPHSPLSPVPGTHLSAFYLHEPQATDSGNPESIDVEIE